MNQRAYNLSCEAPEGKATFVGMAKSHPIPFAFVPLQKWMAKGVFFRIGDQVHLLRLQSYVLVLKTFLYMSALLNLDNFFQVFFLILDVYIII